MQHLQRKVFIYDIIKRGGKGIYTLEFYAKLAPNSVGKDIYAGAGMYHGDTTKNQGMNVISKYETCTLTEDWQKFTVTIELIRNDIKAAKIRLVSQSGDVPMSFIVDDISLTYTPAE